MVVSQKDDIDWELCLNEGFEGLLSGHGKSTINEGFHENIMYKWVIFHGHVK